MTADFDRPRAHAIFLSQVGGIGRYYEMAVDERQCVERLRRGDGDAFDQIYADYRPRIFSFLARMTGQRALAEDLVQETFIRLVRFAPRLSEDTRIGVWLYTVARNLCRSQLRWALVEDSKVEAHGRNSETQPHQPSPFDMTSAREIERAVERALLRLPFEQREALILIAVERLETSDVADLLGLTRDALRQRLSRARKGLARAIERQGVDLTLALQGG